MEFLGKFRVMIVGSGGNGVAAGVRLQEEGFEDYVIIAKHSDFGGVWFQNRYPGCALDDAIMGYQFDFAVFTDWKTTHVSHDEVAGYIQKVAAAHGLYDKTHFETEFLEAAWNDEHLAWKVITNRGYYFAEMLIPVTGYLEEPVVAEIPGRDDFAGRIFHSSNWPEGYTGEGDRIAVVGSGSSALQIVPATQPVARQVTVFQRTPNHILPLNKRVITDEEREEWRNNPEKVHRERTEFFEGRDAFWRSLVLTSGDERTKAMATAALAHLEAQVPDPDLRAALTPHHDFGCKRPGSSDDFYPALLKPNVELVPEGATKIEADAIYSASGKRFEVDTIVLATGFIFGGSILHRIRRRDGVTVGEYQEGHPRAYKSVSVAQAPNLFLCGGAAPNGATWRGLSAGTLVTGYALKAMDYMEGHGIKALEVQEEYEIEWKQKANGILAGGPMVDGGCINYYQDIHGDNKAAWPGPHASMIDAMNEFDASVYESVGEGLTL